MTAAPRSTTADPGWTVVLPFACAGAVVAALVAVRLAVDVPAVRAAFPSQGWLRFTAPLLPSGGAVLTLTPGAVRGLKPVYLATLGGIAALQSVAVVAATAAVCWRVEAGAWVPPADALGWSACYGVGVALLTFGAVWLSAVGGVPPVVWALLVLVAGVVLFLAPAVIVLERTDPLRGVRTAATRFAADPIGITGTVLLVGYVGYALTGVTTLLGGGTVLAYAVGAFVSTTVGGTVHAVFLLRRYRATRPEDGQRAAASDRRASGADPE